jgi:hypothetical protein
VSDHPVSLPLDPRRMEAKERKLTSLIQSRVLATAVIKSWNWNLGLGDRTPILLVQKYYSRVPPRTRDRNGCDRPATAVAADSS